MLPKSSRIRASWNRILPPRKEDEKWGEKKKPTRKREASTMGEKVTMVLARIFKHVSESVPPANTGNFSKLLRR